MSDKKLTSHLRGEVKVYAEKSDPSSHTGIFTGFRQIFDGSET